MIKKTFSMVVCAMLAAAVFLLAGCSFEGLLESNKGGAVVLNDSNNDGTLQYTLTVGSDTATVTGLVAGQTPTGLSIPHSVLKNGTVYTVDQIAASAFSGDTSINSVTISSGVTTIGSNAFNGCTGLQKVNFLGDKIDYLDSGAFTNLVLLIDITVTMSDRLRLYLAGQTKDTATNTAINLVFDDGDSGGGTYFATNVKFSVLK